ncbi:hypothetical protein BJ742DRAFT_811118 [Cladochytrium replicatum]|nr:hypothetical protein BJ742DRAFT_811118 [Cladochytrium replicatum]
MATSLRELKEVALEHARWAVNADLEHDVQLGYTYYIETGQLLLRIVKLEPDGPEKQSFLHKAREYISRAEHLRKLCEIVWRDKTYATSRDLSNRIDYAAMLLDRANDEEKSSAYVQALDLYIAAAEILMKVVQDPDISPQLKQTAVGKAKQSIMSAERLKPIVRQINSSESTGSKSQDIVPMFNQHDLEIIKAASIVNNLIFLPWMAEDSKDTHFMASLFLDPDGLLRLSPKQQKKFLAWKRPSEFITKPQMICFVSGHSIIQETVTDCSFVASMCVAAAYEQRFRSKILTCNIHPQNFDGQPIYNPSGKYVVKIYFNGVARKIVVDDLLPVSRDGSLLCTYSSNRNELWPSILEKAYMKLMGGYDFPGSNSGSDLFMLTGWIPENIYLKEASIYNEDLWMYLFTSFHRGDNLVTIATGPMSDEEADNLGLVQNHSYAVLDIQEECGCRLVLVKNPWNRKRWTGPYSPFDKIHWTPELKKALNFDQLGALQKDDGIFWLSFDSILNIFYSIHVNWNPRNFSCQTILADNWIENPSIISDKFNISSNPQYKLEVADWNDDVTLVLSHHFSKALPENDNFCAIHIYYSNNPSRVFYPDTPDIIGVYSNSPSILVRIPPSKNQFCIVVLSQLHEWQPMTYTLQTYAHSQTQLTRLGQNHQHNFKDRGTLKTSTLKEYVTTLYQIKNETNTPFELTATFECANESPVKMKLGQATESGSWDDHELVETSGDFRHSFCFLDIKNLKGRVYILALLALPQTKEPCDFQINLSTSVPCIVSRI